MQKKIKKNGQVYTPSHIVNLILDSVNYKTSNILNKHIIDNSCGDGAFLVEIVRRYCNEFFRTFDISNTKLLKKQLETYIHGIELDTAEYNKTIQNLNNIVLQYNLDDIKWNILNANALSVDKFNNQMDFVVGNPPYVRIHNLGNDFKKIKSMNFSKKGMTDLFIVFYELGLNMLNSNGKLIYITPNSIFNSLAGQNFRNYVIDNKLLINVINLGHYQPFKKITTYTTILSLDKSNKKDEIKYYEYDDKNLKFISKLDYKDFYIDNNFYFSTKNSLEKFKNIRKIQKNSEICVKNGYATLADKVFINHKFDFDSNKIIKVIKASTGEEKELIYPYDENSNLLEFDSFDSNLQDYLLENQERLINRSINDKDKWYSFGRTQAINDTFRDKISVNSLVKDTENLKIIECESGAGIYSGLYILGLDYSTVQKILKTSDFLEYIQILGKYKSGGYYTFSSSDLEKYLIYNLKGNIRNELQLW